MTNYNYFVTLYLALLGSSTKLFVYTVLLLLVVVILMAAATNHFYKMFFFNYTILFEKSYCVFSL